MSYDQHDQFRDRLNALPLSAGRRGIAAMVLVEIVRWMPDSGASCSRTAEELGDLLKLRPGDLLLALQTLDSLGLIEQKPHGRTFLIGLRPMSPAKPAGQWQAEIAGAIQSHTGWKRRLRHAVDTGGTDVAMDVAMDDVGREDLCAFGLWLHGPSFTDADRDGRWEVICRLHSQFHRVAAATLQLARSGRKAEAERAMGAGGAYSRASLRLSTALTGWRRAITA